MPTAPLSAEEIKTALAALPGWRHEDGALHKEFKFKDFSETFAFMTRIALAAEAMNHHPDWSNSYNRLHISLHHHDSGTITHLDTELAHRIEALNQSHGE